MLKRVAETAVLEIAPVSKRQKRPPACDCGQGKPYRNDTSRQICSHNNLATVYPQISGQWHPTKNGDMRACDYLPGSSEVVWWKCPSDPCGCHEWRNNIRNRVALESGCPFCVKSRPCPHDNLATNFPRIAAEWHPTKNAPTIPTQYSAGAHAAVWWQCPSDPCGCHIWRGGIYTRTITHTLSRCPFCFGHASCPHDNLAVKHPDLVLEWHPDNTKRPTDYRSAATATVLWKCPKNPCGCHVYSMPINCRTQLGQGCPFCSHCRICPHKNLAVLYPELLSEWAPANPKAPTEYAPHSAKRVQWICSRGHQWVATICSRTSRMCGCPHCHTHYSKKQIAWLTDVAREQNIHIQHAQNGGEFRVPGLGMRRAVDGYCRETNTIYQFHGDFWHGNPNRFHPEKIHPYLKVSFGDLWRKTHAFDAQIRALGYTLVIKWESEAPEVPT